MKHNILLIQVDQMHAGCLSLLGNANVHTPHLDQLAREGTLLTNATCQNPLCMPSRASMLSGQYPSTNRQFGFSGLCSRRTPWMQQTFKQAGYTTAAFGKFHLVSVPQDCWTFDVAAGTLPEDEDLARPAGYTYRAYCQKNGIAWRTDQIHGHPLVDGDDMPVLPTSAKPHMHRWEQMACKSDVPAEHSLETWTTSQCLTFLDHQADSERPFFVWLTYDRPHFPTTLPEPWFSRIRPEQIQLPPIPTPAEMATWTRSMFDMHVKHTSIHNLGETSFRFILATYFTLIEWIDSEIGRVLDKLRALGMDQSTTIAFCSDHGDQAGWHGQCDKVMRSQSEEITRVPLIIRPAPMLGATDNRSPINEPVELVDLFPTFCNLTSIRSPRGLDGRDLSAALIHGADLDPHRAVVCEEFNRRMITQDGWKLVFYLDNPTEHSLFDLNADPHGYRNVYHDQAARSQRMRLKRSLLQFLLERQYGPVTEADIAWVQRCLDPDDPQVPLLLRPYEGLHWFGGAAVIFQRGRYLLVPMWDKQMMLFDGDGKYRKRDRACAPDVEHIETMLDLGISECMRHIAQLSPYETRRVTQNPVAMAETQALAIRP
ncbi:MAG: sulfatase-like hydrolase/transferase [Phycisphaeraceae bacterium]|nr:sulfatase-like hydrolase/transferase [Phycisphaeraceae bacterium]